MVDSPLQEPTSEIGSAEIETPPKGYLAQSRDPINSLLMVMPLFIIYQVGILFTDGWKNGADFITGRLIGWMNGNPLLYTGFNLTVLAVVGIAWMMRREKGGIHPRTTFLVIGESTLYAAFMGGVAARLLMKMGLTPTLAVGVPLGGGEPGGLLDAIVLSIGAGTYEELLFRLILLSGAVAAGVALFGKLPGTIAAIVFTSLLFSAAHYVPLGMEPWQIWSFSFRFVLGVFLATLFMTRGFAVAVYTHAIYDLFILVPAALLL